MSTPWPSSASSQRGRTARSEEHTSELQSRVDVVCRILLEKKKIMTISPVVQEEESVPPPIPKRFVEGTGPQITAHARPPINWEQFMGFFFNDTATTEIYTLSLHDALPI